MPNPIRRPNLVLPHIPVQVIDKGERVRNIFGEVKITTVNKEALPTYVLAAEGSAMMDLNGRSGFVRFGSGMDAITLTGEGVQFGSDKVQSWSDQVVLQLIKALTTDPAKAHSAMLLRSALHTSYPMAVARSKQNMSKRMASSMAKGAKGLGSTSMVCSTRTVTETMEKTVTETMKKIKSAEKQFRECCAQEAKLAPCKDLLIREAIESCAWLTCAARSFEDIVVGFIEVVTTIAEEVTRQVVSCVSRPRSVTWPNPWGQGGRLPAGASIGQPRIQFKQQDIDSAVQLLKQLASGLGPFVDCFIKGKWHLAQLSMQLTVDNKTVIPYGVKVCIDDTCATQLALDQVGSQHLAAWGSALAILAALSPEFAVAVGGLIAPAAGAAALIAALPPAVVAAAALILAFIILTMIYATAISAQLLYHKLATDNFKDGQVCIEHPSFALALIKVASLGSVPAELIPPIVTG